MGSAALQAKQFKGRFVWESDEEEPPLPQLEESAFHSLKVHFSRIVELLTQSMKFAENVDLEKISCLEPTSALDHHPFILKFNSSVILQNIFSMDYSILQDLKILNLLKYQIECHKNRINIILFQDKRLLNKILNFSSSPFLFEHFSENS